MKQKPTITITKYTPKEEVIRLANVCNACKLCGKCCQYGSGFLAPGDFAKIAKHLKITEKQLKKSYLEKVEKFNQELYRPRLIKKDRPYGVCIFYNKVENCTIHGVKPLHCKVTAPCSDYGDELDQWFNLNYVVNPADPESIRQLATFLKFREVIPGGELKELVKDKGVLNKILSYKILK